MNTFMLTFARLFALLLIISGIIAIVRQRATASPEFEDEREYRGPAATRLGMLWIALGAAIALFPDLLR